MTPGIALLILSFVLGGAANLFGWWSARRIDRRLIAAKERKFETSHPLRKRPAGT